ncbi:hypothetical protein F2Q68_00034737 [Brassica cretica]|uniref:Uncharacterized protein n=1 Tax=Brassica cretica TaxID=69181 RepID=A0A8S9GYJ2_BRACR|nr:hypothetical protein F2Q68_00034737 [Brassica cretica]
MFPKEHYRIVETKGGEVGDNSKRAKVGVFRNNGQDVTRVGNHSIFSKLDEKDRACYMASWSGQDRDKPHSQWELLGRKKLRARFRALPVAKNRDQLRVLSFIFPDISSVKRFVASRVRVIRPGAGRRGVKFVTLAGLSLAHHVALPDHGVGLDGQSCSCLIVGWPDGSGVLQSGSPVPSYILMLGKENFLGILTEAISSMKRISAYESGLLLRIEGASPSRHSTVDCMASNLLEKICSRCMRLVGGTSSGAGRVQTSHRSDPGVETTLLVACHFEGLVLVPEDSATTVGLRRLENKLNPFAKLARITIDRRNYRSVGQSLQSFLRGSQRQVRGAILQQQGPGENLRSLYEILQQGYIAPFNQEKVVIRECSIPTAISAFKRGLLPDGELYKKLTKCQCKTMEDVLSRALAQVKWEEDVASRAKA